MDDEMLNLGVFFISGAWNERPMNARPGHFAGDWYTKTGSHYLKHCELHRLNSLGLLFPSSFQTKGLCIKSAISAETMHKGLYHAFYDKD